MRSRTAVSATVNRLWLAIAAGAFIGHAFTPVVTVAQDAVPAQNALAGSRVFGSKGCSRCHALHGIGGSGGPDLAQLASGRSIYDLAAAMWNHLPGMVAQMDELGIMHPSLSEREAADLVAFLQSLGFFDAAGSPDRGKGVFESKGCFACHQVGGVGGVIGPNLGNVTRAGAPVQIATAMWNHGPRMSELMEERGIARPRFSATELADLIAFLRSEEHVVSAEPVYVLPGVASNGARLFAEKGCGACHAAQEGSGRRAPDLSERGVSSSMLAFATAMWNKAPTMTAKMRASGITPPKLEPREMADIVAYLASVRYFAEPGDPQRGRSMLRAGCTSCHKLEGRGGDRAPDLATVRDLEHPAAVIAALWNHVVVGGDIPADGSWPTLRPGDVADLSAFLAARARR